jgi:hypothetical protein
MFKLLSLPVNKMETYEDYCLTKHEIDDPLGSKGIKQRRREHCVGEFGWMRGDLMFFSSSAVNECLALIAIGKMKRFSNCSNVRS